MDGVAELLATFPDLAGLVRRRLNGAHGAMVEAMVAQGGTLHHSAFIRPALVPATRRGWDQRRDHA